MIDRYRIQEPGFIAHRHSWRSITPGLITGCGGSGYEFGDDVLKFPSASRGNPAAAGFAESFPPGFRFLIRLLHRHTGIGCCGITFKI
jgi:hypothetical protein